MAATTTQQGVAPSGTNVIGKDLMGMWADPKAKKAFYLSVTSAINDMFQRKGIRWQKATVLGLSDYIALMFINPVLAGPLAQMTGETLWSGLLAEGVSLSVFMMLAKNVGLIASDKAVGPVESPDLGSGQVANWLESVVDTALLLGERQVLVMLGQNLNVIPANGY